MRHFIGSLWIARRIASRATCSLGKDISKITRPGLTLATHHSGEPLPEHALVQTTRYFSDMQDPNKARLTLIQGEINGQGMEGLSYHLKADQHIVGRNGQVEFPDDRRRVGRQGEGQRDRRAVHANVGNLPSPEGGEPGFGILEIGDGILNGIHIDRASGHGKNLGNLAVWLGGKSPSGGKPTE